VALVAVLQLVFLALLVVGAAFPDRPIVAHLRADVASGAYGPSNRPDGQGGRATSFTDCVAAGTGLGAPRASVWHRAIAMPRLESCVRGTAQIRRLAAGEAPRTRLEYFRYWAGYTVLTRPVLAVGGMDGMRLVAGGLFGLALLAMATTLSRVLGGWYAVALTAPLLLSSNVLSVPATAFSHALSLAVAFAGVALVARTAARRPVTGPHADRAVLCAVAVSACVFDFVDLLTTPAIPWALTSAVVAALTWRRTGSVGDTFWAGVVAATVWFAAFVATWVSRWLLTVPFLGFHHVSGVVTGIARFRIDGQYGSVSHVFGAAVVDNVRTWLRLPVTPEPVLVASLVWGLVALAVAWRRYGAQRLVVAAVLAAPALIAPLWMLVLSNHSQIHDVFVYRTVPASLGIALAACLVSSSPAPRGSG
jgi:hypothetical protein